MNDTHIGMTGAVKMDFLEIYKKFFMEGHIDYNLNEIAKEELTDGKIDANYEAKYLLDNIDAKSLIHDMVFDIETCGLNGEDQPMTIVVGGDANNSRRIRESLEDFCRENVIVINAKSYEEQRHDMLRDDILLNCVMTKEDYEREMIEWNTPNYAIPYKQQFKQKLKNGLYSKPVKHQYKPQGVRRRGRK